MVKKTNEILLKITHLPEQELIFQKTEQREHVDQKVLKILAAAFLNNPRMFSLIGKNASNFEKKVRIILNYSYYLSKRLKGVFFSSNEKTVLLLYRKSEFKHY